MYRRPGSDSGSFRVTEKKCTDLSTEHYSEPHDREKDVFIKSRTFQNSNWRGKVSESSAHPGKKEMAAVNSCMPHFMGNQPTTTTNAPIQPLKDISAVDNLTPKFLSMDINNHNDSSQNYAYQPVKNIQNSGNNSWRRPNNSYSQTGLHYSVRRKFHLGTELSVSEKKLLAKPVTLVNMTKTKTSLYDSLNDLNCKTKKVQMDDFEREEEACHHVKQEMLSKFPKCAVTPYGIRLLGMAHPNSAIYMFFDTGSNYFQSSCENKELQTEVRKTVFNVMKNCGHCIDVLDWDVQELVTFNHIGSEMNCVISFVNGFKDLNTQLLKYYLRMDKRVRLLMLLVTDMVYNYHDISKYFTSYVLNIMVIMFLQRIEEPVLPTLQKLRDSAPYEKVIIGDFDCGFPREICSEISNKNHSSVENLLKGFCEFYKDYNFEEEVVSIIGPHLKRSMFLPPFIPSVDVEPLSSFFLSLKKGAPKMNFDKPVLVQDPFELSCNAAEKVNDTVLGVFKMLCQDAFEILSKWC